jgi:hypothetical protein
MQLRAPNGWLFVIALFLAMTGLLATFSPPLALPDIASEHAGWFIFLAWFMMAAGSIVPSQSAKAASAETPAA